MIVSTLNWCLCNCLRRWGWITPSSPKEQDTTIANVASSAINKSLRLPYTSTKERQAVVISAKLLEEKRVSPQEILFIDKITDGDEKLIWSYLSVSFEIRNTCVLLPHASRANDGLVFESKHVLRQRNISIKEILRVDKETRGDMQQIAEYRDSKSRPVYAPQNFDKLFHAGDTELKNPYLLTNVAEEIQLIFDWHDTHPLDTKISLFNYWGLEMYDILTQLFGKDSELVEKFSLCHVQLKAQYFVNTPHPRYAPEFVSLVSQLKQIFQSCRGKFGNLDPRYTDEQKNLLIRLKKAVELGEKYLFVDHSKSHDMLAFRDFCCADFLQLRGRQLSSSQPDQNQTQRAVSLYTSFNCSCISALQRHYGASKLFPVGLLQLTRNLKLIHDDPVVFYQKVRKQQKEVGDFCENLPKELRNYKRIYQFPSLGRNNFAFVKKMHELHVVQVRKVFEEIATSMETRLDAFSGKVPPRFIRNHLLYMLKMLDTILKTPPSARDSNLSKRLKGLLQKNDDLKTTTDVLVNGKVDSSGRVISEGWTNDAMDSLASVSIDEYLIKFKRLYLNAPSSIAKAIDEESRKDGELMLTGHDVMEQIEQISRDRIEALMGYFITRLIAKDFDYITSMKYPDKKDFSIEKLIPVKIVDFVLCEELKKRFLRKSPEDISGSSDAYDQLLAFAEDPLAGMEYDFPESFLKAPPLPERENRPKKEDRKEPEKIPSAQTLRPKRRRNQKTSRTPRTKVRSTPSRRSTPTPVSRRSTSSQAMPQMEPSFKIPSHLKKYRKLQKLLRDHGIVPISEIPEIKRPKDIRGSHVHFAHRDAPEIVFPVPRHGGSGDVRVKNSIEKSAREAIAAAKKTN